MGHHSPGRMLWVIITMPSHLYFTNMLSLVLIYKNMIHKTLVYKGNLHFTSQKYARQNVRYFSSLFGCCALYCHSERNSCYRLSPRQANAKNIVGPANSDFSPLKKVQIKGRLILYTYKLAYIVNTPQQHDLIYNESVTRLQIISHWWQTLDYTNRVYLRKLPQ